MPTSLAVIGIELAAALAMLAPALRSFLKQPSNRVRRSFLAASFLFATGFVIDAVGRLAIYKPTVITDAFFRLAELFLLAGAVAFVHLAAVFPRRVAPRILPREGPRRRTRLFFLMLALILFAAALGLLNLSGLYVTGRFYRPADGTYYGEYGPAYWLNRIFIVTLFAIAIREQRRFLRFHERDPRRVHSRYFIYASGTLAFGFVAACALPLQKLENEFMAVQALLVFAFNSFLHNTLENLHLNYRTDFARYGVLLLSYLLTLLPLYFVVSALLEWSLRADPTVAAFALAGVFFVFHGLVRLLTPFLQRLFFKREARLDQKLAEFNRSVLQMQSMGGMRQLRRQIALFLEDIYAPRCLALYFPTRGEGESSRELAQDAGLARIADAESIPPQRLSPTLLAFLRQYRLESGEEGGLAADLIAQAERYGDPLAVERLTALAACGVEIILPLYGEDRRAAPGASAGGAGDAVATAADAEWPEAVIVLGLLSEGRPLDHGDLLWLRLLRTPALLALKNQELLGAMTELTERLEEENKRITSRLERDLQGFSQAGSAAAFVFKPGGRLAQVIAQAERFADMDAPVLITGETGSGKGAIARLIHGVSRRQGKFLTVNCSAIPRDLIENELFGHEKGAYTGAVEASEGLVARAAGGTLFFDEIGELPLEGQTKLLRLVQEGAFERIGSNETLQSTARFLFATNRNLEVEAQEGRFRLDLFFRISALEIHAPPLRERREDIPLLVDHFLWNAGRNMGREGLRFTPAALELLLRHNWPGNVRELENLILRAVALSEANLLDVDQLPVMFRDDMDFDRKRTHLERIGVERERLERELLLEAMRRSEGNQREAARLLNISRGSLQYRLRQYGLV